MLNIWKLSKKEKSMTYMALVNVTINSIPPNFWEGRKFLTNKVFNCPNSDCCLETCYSKNIEIRKKKSSTVYQDQHATFPYKRGEELSLNRIRKKHHIFNFVTLVSTIIKHTCAKITKKWWWDFKRIATEVKSGLYTQLG